MKKLYVLGVLIFLAFMVKAQDATLESDVELPDTTDYLPEYSTIIQNYNTQLDSLVNLWYVQKAEKLKFSDISKHHRDTAYIPQYSDKEYSKRISQMNSVVKLTYNSKVKAYINVYANKRRSSVSNMLGMSEYYFPIFEDIFERYDIPQELKYLAIIESALNPKAKSCAGARGIWQFMPSTGKAYDLKINSYIDERCDPVKSTYAAAQYLKQLNEIFDDWVLTIAAYNCGPGNVRKAIARAGGRTDFWQIYNYLPKETRSYVPAFIAAYYVFEHHELHNLYPRKIAMPQIDTVMVLEKMDFKQVSEYLHVSLQELEDINPQYKIGIVPYSPHGSPLYLPVEVVSPFLRLQDSIYAYKDSMHPSSEPEKEIASSNTSSEHHQAVPTGKVKKYYTVRSGDNFSKIASKYGVPVSTLKSWNSKKSNMLHVGEKLVVYVAAPAKASPAPKLEKTEITDKVTASVMYNKPTNTTSEEDISYYTVKAGDTLWSISQRYGTTVQTIQSLNGLSTAQLSPGMNLRIQ